MGLRPFGEISDNQEVKVNRQQCHVCTPPPQSFPNRAWDGVYPLHALRSGDDGHVTYCRSVDGLPYMGLIVIYSGTTSKSVLSGDKIHWDIIAKGSTCNKQNFMNKINVAL
ncbi:hypothetical protein ACTXT7_002986 [Hymenolepis weldensis]